MQLVTPETCAVCDSDSGNDKATVPVDERGIGLGEVLTKSFCGN
jgi:hypothetical protein